MSNYPGFLERLYARHTLISTGRADGDSRLVHRAIIERLAANRRIAEREGWTALALERVGSMGQLTLSGVPASAARRTARPRADCLVAAGSCCVRDGFEPRPPGDAQEVVA
jgi:hypothetical protein